MFASTILGGKIENESQFRILLLDSKSQLLAHEPTTTAVEMAFLSALMLSALKVRDFMLSLLSAILLLLTVLWTSAFIYGSFYLAYVPSSDTHAVPANFEFQVCNLTDRCSFPRAEVDLLRQSPRGGGHLLLPGQKYSVSLHLRMPRSRKNLVRSRIPLRGVSVEETWTFCFAATVVALAATCYWSSFVVDDDATCFAGAAAGAVVHDVDASGFAAAARAVTVTFCFDAAVTSC